MKRLFHVLAIFVVIWVLGSFLGVMFDPPRANVWTQSLMWALLASVILAPVFLFFSTDASDSSPSPPSPPRADPPFEVEESVDVRPQEKAGEKEEWPYTS